MLWAKNARRSRRVGLRERVAAGEVHACRIGLGALAVLAQEST